MKKTKMFVKTLPARKQTKKQKEAEEKQQQKQNDWLKDFNRKVGINTPLDEFREILKSEGKKFVEIKNVKSFFIPAGGQGGYGKEIEYKDISTMIITQYSSWYPRANGGAWGSSGPYDDNNPRWISGFSTYGYDLTYDEMADGLKDCPGWGETIRLTKKSEHFYDLEYRSDHKGEGCSTELDILRGLAQKKLDMLSKTKTYVYYINGVRFEYTANVNRTTIDTVESHTNSYYFYDKDGKYFTSIGGHGLIYG